MLTQVTGENAHIALHAYSVMTLNCCVLVHKKRRKASNIFFYILFKNYNVSSSSFYVNQIHKRSLKMKKSDVTLQIISENAVKLRLV